MTAMEQQGVILKGIGGFYYVETALGVFECKAKGKFRKERLTPLAGDHVTVTLREGQENTIDSIAPRKNALGRPPVANVDQLLIVVSSAKPVPNPFVIDKLTAIAEQKHIQPVLVFSKNDLAPAEEWMKIYRTTGYPVLLNTELDEIKALLKGKCSALTGNTGAGKSTLLNALCPELELPTGEISEKLGRGRHTTRHAELFHVAEGLVIDTAGFSSIDSLKSETPLVEELETLFPEFAPFLGQCKFTTCAHTGEKGCRICEAVRDGVISESRHQSYLQLLQEAKDQKPW